MELFISEAEIEDASMIIDYLNQVGGESDNLTYGLNDVQVYGNTSDFIKEYELNNKESLIDELLKVN